MFHGNRFQEERCQEERRFCDFQSVRKLSQTKHHTQGLLSLRGLKGKGMTWANIPLASGGDLSTGNVIAKPPLQGWITGEMPGLQGPPTADSGRVAPGEGSRGRESTVSSSGFLGFLPVP